MWGKFTCPISVDLTTGNPLCIVDCNICLISAILALSGSIVTGEAIACLTGTKSNDLWDSGVNGSQGIHFTSRRPWYKEWVAASATHFAVRIPTKTGKSILTSLLTCSHMNFSQVDFKWSIASMANAVIQLFLIKSCSLLKNAPFWAKLLQVMFHGPQALVNSQVWLWSLFHWWRRQRIDYRSQVRSSRIGMWRLRDWGQGTSIIRMVIEMVRRVTPPMKLAAPIRANAPGSIQDQGLGGKNTPAGALHAGKQLRTWAL